MTVCESSRLRVRRFCLDDAEFILRLVNEPAFRDNIGDKGVRNLADARVYLRDGPLQSYEDRGFGLSCVELREDAVPIGLCGLLKRDGIDDVEIGYAFLCEYWGQGYAIESARAVVADASATHEIRRLAAIVTPENLPSVRLLEKLGFSFERMVTLGDEPPIALYGGAC